MEELIMFMLWCREVGRQMPVCRSCSGVSVYPAERTETAEPAHCYPTLVDDCPLDMCGLHDKLIQYFYNMLMSIIICAYPLPGLNDHYDVIKEGIRWCMGGGGDADNHVTFRNA